MNGSVPFSAITVFNSSGIFSSLSTVKSRSRSLIFSSCMRPQPVHNKIYRPRSAAAVRILLMFALSFLPLLLSSFLSFLPDICIRSPSLISVFSVFSFFHCRPAVFIRSPPSVLIYSIFMWKKQKYTLFPLSISLIFLLFSRGNVRYNRTCAPKRRLTER